MNEDRIEIWDQLTLFGRRFYWRAVSANNAIVAGPGEGYNSEAARNKGLAAARRILGNTNTPIVDGRTR